MRPSWNNIPHTARVAVFGIVVAVLTVLGWLALSGDPAPIDMAPDTPPASRTVPNAGPQASTGPVTAPPKVTVTMPLTQQGLQAAADAAASFTTEYLSYRFDQDDAAKLASLTAMLAPDGPDLSGVIPSPDERAEHAATRFVATAAVTGIDTVTAAAGMVAFDVQVTVATTRAGKTGAATAHTYAVAVAADNGWTVTDFEPVTADAPVRR